MVHRWFVLGLLVASAWSDSAPPFELHSHQVNTTLGPIDGIREVGRTGKYSIAYYGIPYAEAPVGDLRFKPPVPLTEHSDEVFHADAWGQECYQNAPAFIRRSYPPGNGSEDCLMLNVWIPEPYLENAAVMIYFHGGGFYMGSVNRISGATLATEGNIIVVTVAYRLGVLGFLSLGTPSAPGNAGLLDQQMALKWVHDNIHAFGGDPNKITLAGTSSGGASVGYHVLSEGSNKLFQRGVLMSGVPTNRWAFQMKDGVIKQSMQIAEKLGYHGDASPEHVAEFLRTKTPEELIEANVFEDLIGGNVLGPTVDGNFIDNYPHLLVEKAAHNGHHIEMVFGTTSHEGALVMMGGKDPTFFRRHEDGRITKEEFVQLLKVMDHRVMNDLVAGATMSHYLDFYNLHDPHSFRDGAIKVIGDYLFSCGAEQFADYFASANHTVYKYIYNARPPFPGLSWIKAVHGSDAPVLFGETIPLAHYRNFTLDLISHLSNFVQNGNPNLQRDIDKGSFQWPKYEQEHRSVLMVNPDKYTLENHPGAEQCFYMRSIRPLLSKISQCRQGLPTDSLVQEATKQPKKNRILDEMLLDLVSVSIPKASKPWSWALNSVN